LNADDALTRSVLVDIEAIRREREHRSCVVSMDTTSSIRVSRASLRGVIDKRHGRNSKRVIPLEKQNRGFKAEVVTRDGRRRRVGGVDHGH
jgi:hypothetical protein